MKDGLEAQQKAIIEEVKRQIPSVLNMPEPDRSRCLTCLAHEYILQDMEEEGFKLIEQCDPSYFSDHVFKDMENNPSMNRVFMTMLAKLIDSGYVKVTPKEEGEDES